MAYVRDWIPIVFDNKPKEAAKIKQIWIDQKAKLPKWIHISKETEARKKTSSKKINEASRWEYKIV